MLGVDLFVKGLLRSLRRANMEEKIEGEMRLLYCSKFPVEVSQSRTFWKKKHLALCRFRKLVSKVREWWGKKNAKQFKWTVSANIFS